MIAHISEDKKRKQTVRDHLNNVSTLAGEFLREANLPIVGELIGLLHDMGKYSDDFNEYITNAAAGITVERGSVNHALCGAKYVEDNFSKKDLLTSQMLASAIFSHHGGLIDMTDIYGNDMYHEKYNTKYNIRYEDCVKRFNEDMVDSDYAGSLFEKATLEVNKAIQKIASDYPKAQKKTREGERIENVRSFALSLLEKLMFSALIDADRYDTYLFEADENFEDALRRERECGEKEFWQSMSERLNDYTSKFKEKNLLINKIRNEISDACSKASEMEDGIYRLCVPTGGGKTLSSLRYAVEHCKKFSKRKIFYFIPYQSIIDQNAEVIRDCLGEENVLVHHSNVINGTENEKVLSEYELLTQRWSRPVVLSTMVQFLNTFYNGGTRDVRRLHSLCNSVIVFDEVQALSVECSALFTQAVNFLKTVCNADIVLCSATQPDFENLPNGYGAMLNKKDADLVPQYRKYFEELKRCEIVCLLNRKMSCKEFGKFAYERSCENETTLVIMNTKAAAKKLYDELRERGCYVKLLTTKLCGKHRRAVFEEIKNPKSNNFICISTQLVEAGVDIDMDCVIRSFAGFDSLAQACGRCNRNGRKGIKKVYFVKADFEDLSHLKQIRDAQAAAENVISHMSEEEKNDLLAPEIMERYCQAYRCESGEKEIKYPVDMKSDGFPEMTMCDLLIKGFSGRKIENLLLKQAFKTAGEKFKAIETETKSVIVPFEEGVAVIEKLMKNPPLSERWKLLKEAKSYCVNIFNYEFEKMKSNNGLIYLTCIDAYAVCDGMYDAETGLDVEAFPNTVY